MIAKVTAVAMNRVTRERICDPREEEIDDGNELFIHCKTAMEVEEAYESFWNDMNPHSKEIVKVLNVEMQ